MKVWKTEHDKNGVGARTYLRALDTLSFSLICFAQSLVCLSDLPPKTYPPSPVRGAPSYLLPHPLRDEGIPWRGTMEEAVCFHFASVTKYKIKRSIFIQTLRFMYRSSYLLYRDMRSISLARKARKLWHRQTPLPFYFPLVLFFFSPHNEARRESGNRAHISRSSNYS